MRPESLYLATFYQQIDELRFRVVIATFDMAKAFEGIDVLAGHEHVYQQPFSEKVTRLGPVPQTLEVAAVGKKLSKPRRGVEVTLVGPDAE